MSAPLKESKNDPLSLVFFGTGPVSLASLDFLARHFKLEAVVTKPDPIVHGQARAGEVKKWAIEHDIPRYQPGGPSELDELFRSQSFASQLGVVVDYGLIIPESVIKAFPRGIVNSHFSLLPHLRGADPITAAILEGLEETGVSLMLIAASLDTGKLIAQAAVKMPLAASNRELTKQLIALSNRLLLSTLPAYASREIKPWAQIGTPTYTRKLTKSDGAIDWTKPAEQLEREVRAYQGWPGSYTRIAGRDVTITRARIFKLRAAAAKAGAVAPSLDRLIIQTGRDGLEITRLKPAGKREMSADDFKRGYLRLEPRSKNQESGQ